MLIVCLYADKLEPSVKPEVELCSLNTRWDPKITGIIFFKKGSLGFRLLQL
jgi:hypothetical protein